MKSTDLEKMTIEALRMEGKPIHRGGVSFQRCLLPLTREKDDKECTYRAQPQKLFLPRGLAIWGAPPGAMLSFATIGANLQIVCAVGDVPARFFAQGDSYEQIAQKLDAGAEPPAWCDWDPIGVGVWVRIQFRDQNGEPLRDPLELAMWGIAAL